VVGKLSESDPTPEELGDILGAARLLGVLPYVKVELERMEEQVISRVFSAMDAGALSPDVALNAWMELRAYRRLFKRLDTRAKLVHNA